MGNDFARFLLQCLALFALAMCLTRNAAGLIEAMLRWDIGGSSRRAALIAGVALAIYLVLGV